MLRTRIQDTLDALVCLAKHEIVPATARHASSQHDVATATE